MIGAYSLDSSVLMLSDSIAKDSPEDIAAMVASGDCFVTLATTIEAVSQSLTKDAETAGPQLEWLAATLLYLQRHYKIEPKKPRQLIPLL